MAQQTQSGYSSKTNILGALQLITGIVALLTGSELIKNHPNWIAGLMAANGIITMIIRQMTTLPISWSGKP